MRSVFTPLMDEAYNIITKFLTKNDMNEALCDECMENLKCKLQVSETDSEIILDYLRCLEEDEDFQSTCLIPDLFGYSNI